MNSCRFTLQLFLILSISIPSFGQIDDMIFLQGNDTLKAMKSAEGAGDLTWTLEGFLRADSLQIHFKPKPDVGTDTLDLMFGYGTHMIFGQRRFLAKSVCNTQPGYRCYNLKMKIFQDAELERVADKYAAGKGDSRLVGVFRTNDIQGKHRKAVFWLPWIIIKK